MKSVSSKSLNATLRDINAVTSLTDRAAGNFLYGKSTKVIFHDLADEMISNCNEGTFILEDNTGMMPVMKRELVTMALDDLTPTDSEFGANRCIKRLKTEVLQKLWCMFMIPYMNSFELLHYISFFLVVSA